ncbi:chitin disaccharide deacetylase [Niallia sp. NCCP-28]|uniref:chitin disaccharide deacetylase n=1 Tax=Niallia sp. NCCP-28 TaxID=2934712 RepID=UPI00208759CB|nr:chitin disaccharide deacetylase [Niallia sp. NCCP-28]GKU83753.1 carbohydrate deacetylase [Niallia sp. NCCP-28]
MIKVLVNADDFGFSHGVNYGIMDCHKYGLVNSATMMMNAEATEHGIELAKGVPTLKVGVHLVLTWGKPLSNNVPSLIDENGNFKKQQAVYGNPQSIDLVELEQEWTAQIERFIQAGLEPTHLDSHHHVHGIKGFYPVIKKLSDSYQIPVRHAGSHFKQIQTVTDLLLTDFYGETAVPDYFIELGNRVKDVSSVEIMTHPAYLDHELLQGSSYNQQRVKETSILKSAVLPSGFSLL